MLVVLEGLDGAGKSTQVKKFRSFLESRCPRMEYIHFPRYDVAPYGGLMYKNFRIGYTFDYNFGNVSQLSGSAHEVMLSYSVQTKKTKVPYERFE